MPKISPPDHRTYQQWLYLEPDGELSRVESAALERHLASCPACRTLRHEIEALEDRLAAATVEADPELARQVMANLPAAGWEARNLRAWRPAAAVFAAVALAAFLVASAGGGAASASSMAPVLGAARAVTDLLLTTALAGAGLLTASWQGLGLALGQVFGGSKLTLGVFAVFVAGVDFLFVRYLLRQPRRALARPERRR